MKVIKDLLKVFTDDRSTLFLENDYDLYHVDGDLEKFLIDHKKKYNILARIDTLPMEYILDQINWYDIIAFQTTWVTGVSQDLREMLYKHKFSREKIIVECVMNEPTWHYLPDLPQKHQMYAFDTHTIEYMDEDMEEYWSFKKLRKTKALWED